MKKTLKIAYRGIDSGIRKRSEDGEIISVPSTGEIGRSFLWAHQSLLFFTNPLFKVRTRAYEEQSLITRIYEKQSSLSILNIGCGSCADMPLLEEMIYESLMDRRIKNPRVTIINGDLSTKVLKSVRSGNHPYFECKGGIGFIEGEINERIEQYEKTHFEIAEKLKMPANHGFLFLSLGRISDQTGYETVQSYKMKKEFREKLSLVKADVRDLDFPDESFDVVIAHNLLRYLEDRAPAEKELRRVLKEGGFLFPHGRVYQKNKNKLQRVSGGIGVSHWKLKNSSRPYSKENMIWDDGIDQEEGGVLPVTVINGKRKPFCLDPVYKQPGGDYAHIVTEHLKEVEGCSPYPDIKL